MEDTNLIILYGGKRGNVQCLFIWLCVFSMVVYKQIQKWQMYIYRGQIHVKRKFCSSLEKDVLIYHILGLESTNDCISTVLSVFLYSSEK